MDVLTFVTNIARLEGRASPREFNVYILTFVTLLLAALLFTAIDDSPSNYPSLTSTLLLWITHVLAFHATVRRMRATGWDRPWFAKYVRHWSFLSGAALICWIAFDWSGLTWPVWFASIVGVLLSWAVFPAWLVMGRALVVTNGFSSKPLREWNWSDD